MASDKLTYTFCSTVPLPAHLIHIGSTGTCWQPRTERSLVITAVLCGHNYAQSTIHGVPWHVERKTSVSISIKNSTFSPSHKAELFLSACPPKLLHMPPEKAGDGKLGAISFWAGHCWSVLTSPTDAFMECTAQGVLLWVLLSTSTLLAEGNRKQNPILANFLSLSSKLVISLRGCEGDPRRCTLSSG